MNNELKEIKKIYGEAMMHLCRELFPSILEDEGRLLSILKNNLAPTHSFALDIIDEEFEQSFKNWIHALNEKKEEVLLDVDKTPFELMEEAGYNLYECNSEEDIQKFKKYYIPREELCTFNGGRLERCHVFFAVKKNVDEIKREDFPNPKREDLYGTSVISIQFDRGKMNAISIKNRYNHTVDNPDATFSNNLENIIPGLTNSFEKQYGFSINYDAMPESIFLTALLPYTRAKDKKYYRYNVEEEGIYYCENNIIIAGGIVYDTLKKNTERYILIEQFIIDLKEKAIFLTDIKSIDHSFVESINSVGNISKIDVKRNGENRLITFQYENGRQVNILINRYNQIVEYDNPYVKGVGDYFLYKCRKLSKISIPSVLIIGNNFINTTEEITSIDLPMVKTIGNGFLYQSWRLSKISIPNVQIIGDDFILENVALKSIDLPMVKTIGESFLRVNETLDNISLPKVKEVGSYFLENNHSLKSISLPEVETIRNHFLARNECLEYIYLPHVKTIDYYMLSQNQALKSIDLPEVERISDCFLRNNKVLTSISAPHVKIILSDFLYRNEELTSIDLPELIFIGRTFLANNKKLTKVSIPCVEAIGALFLKRHPLLWDMKKEIVQPDDIGLYITFIQDLFYNNKKL